MYLRQLYLTNFGPHEELNLEFEHGLNGIYGRNGSGKSSAINAVYSALTGDWSRHVLGKSGCIRCGATNCSVDIKLSLNNNDEATISRILAPKPSQRLSWGDRELTKSEDIAEWMNVYLHLTRRIIDNYMIIPQGEMYGFLDVSPRERTERFSQLCGTDVAEKIRAVLHDFKNKSDTRKSGDDIVYQNYKRLLGERDEYIDLLTRQQDELNELSAKITVDNDEIEDYTAYLSMYETKKAAASSLKELKKEIEQLDRDIESSDIAFAATVDQLESITATVDDNRAMVDSFREVLFLAKKSVEDRASCDYLLSQIRSMNADKLELQSQLTEWDGPDIERVQSDLAELEHQYKTEKRLLERSSELNDSQDSCPVCHAKRENWNIDPTALASQVRQYRETITEYKQTVDKYDEFVAHTDNVKAKLAELEGSLAAVKENYVKFESQLKHYSEDDIKNANNWITWESDQLKQISKLEQNKAVYTQKNSSCRLSKAELSESLTKCLLLVDGIDEIEVKVELKRQLMEQMFALRSQRDVLQDRVNASQNRLTTINAEIAKCEPVMAKRAGVEKFVSLVDDSMRILHRDNLPHAIHCRVLNGIVENINDELANFEAPFVISVEDDLTFTAHFTKTGMSITAGALSGGQKVLLGFAYWFALQTLFARQIGIMILDEPTDGLDRYNREKSIDVLMALRNRINKKNQQVIIITHDELLTPVFDKVHHIGEE